MEEVIKPPVVPQVDASRFKLAEHERNIHSVTIEQGINRAQVIDPAFFAHVAPKCRPYDEILVRCDDGATFARLLVLQAERTWLRVHVIEWHDLTTRDVAQSQSPQPTAAVDKEKEFLIAWKGPHLKWCVIRQCDKQPVREKEESKQAAQNWLADWLRITA